MGSTVAERSRTVWCMRLHAAVRTAMACGIVGSIALYAPQSITSHLKFPAFSYLTAILIVSDATLGDTFRGCCHAVYATFQVVPVSMLLLWIVGPARLGTCMAALAVAVASFLVALPESTPLMAKRIAFGQIVIVCTDAVLGGDENRKGFMYPSSVASSTALGAVASVLALMVPYPRLAYHEVGKLCRLYADNASERMNIYLKAFSSQDNRTKAMFTSQAKPLTETGRKLLQSIRNLQEGMKWEKPWSRYHQSDPRNPEDILQALEMPMRGIENALISSPAIPAQIADTEQLSSVSQLISMQLKTKLQQHRHSTTAPESRGEFLENPLLPLESVSLMPNCESVFFLFSCLESLMKDTSELKPVTDTQEVEQTDFSIRTAVNSWMLKLKNERLGFAIKCSLSLGLAVLFGLIFDQENGCWSGLTLAISFVTGKQAVFTVANTRAQGTAIGSVYGVICCFLFQTYTETRFLALIPWIIFTSFLRHSRMYGQTGGVSAAIGALLILGRKNYGTPDEFAISRLTEVCIGLSCFVMVELLLQPTRAATLAKRYLHMSLASLQDTINHICCYSDQKELSTFFQDLRQKQRNLKYVVGELEKFIADVELEPDFWYLPFRTSCYQKLQGCFSNIADLMHFVIYNLEMVSGLMKNSAAMREFVEEMNNDFKVCLETLTSLSVLPQEPRKKVQDIEEGKDNEELKVWITEDGEEQKILSLFHQQLVEIGEVEDAESKKDSRRLVHCMGALCFCISSLRKEIREVEIGIRELLQWEHHARR